MIIVRTWTGEVWTADDHEAAKQMVRDEAAQLIDDEFFDHLIWMDDRAVIWREGEPSRQWWDLEEA